jgi:hypothetical protein
MLLTPLALSASAEDSPEMLFQLICSPAATTSDSYVTEPPLARVTLLFSGWKVATFSGTRAMWLGMRSTSRRRRSLFCFRPAPTSVHPGW